MLSAMESESVSADPHDAGAELARAKAMRTVLADGLRLPSWFHASIGAAVTVQIATTSYGVAASSSVPAIAALVAGLVLFAGVAVGQLARFRRLNGVSLGGLVSRAVLGSATWTPLVYGLAMAGALQAALAGTWWLTAVAAIAGGLGYAWCGQRWWSRYRRDPVAQAQGEPPLLAITFYVVGLAGLVALQVRR